LYEEDRPSACRPPRTNPSSGGLAILVRSSDPSQREGEPPPPPLPRARIPPRPALGRRGAEGDLLCHRRRRDDRREELGGGGPHPDRPRGPGGQLRRHFHLRIPPGPPGEPPPPDGGWAWGDRPGGAGRLLGEPRGPGGGDGRGR